MAFQFDPARGFGVYIHWPYCARICPYCDFNVYAAKSRDTAPLLTTILADLEGWRARTGPRRVDSIFLGGGSPSLMSGADVERAIDRVGALWELAPEAEITLEANPDDQARFADFRSAGVNRLSLGVQSLDDRRLRFLGRNHSGKEARRALAAARAIFPSISADFIYALPDETLAGWGAELGDALTLDIDHLSPYELTIEPGAAFSRAVRRGEWAPADEERAADLYELTQDMTEAAGYPAYEISNHARDASHQSRHNRIYWRCGDWVGVGPGAHGRLTAEGRRLAVEAADRPGAYVAAVKARGLGWEKADALTALDEARERLAMGLRVSEGIDPASIAQLGLEVNQNEARELARLGLVQMGAGRIALSRAGRLAADRIVQLLSP